MMHVMATAAILVQAQFSPATAFPATAGPAAAPAPQAPLAGVLATDEDDELEWIDRLLELLHWLCEYLGPEYCDYATSDADVHLLAFTTTYNSDGLPALDESEQLRCRTIIEDIYDHLDQPLSGTPSVIAEAREALESAYEDLEGDTTDL